MGESEEILKAIEDTRQTIRVAKSDLTSLNSVVAREESVQSAKVHQSKVFALQQVIASAENRILHFESIQRINQLGNESIATSMMYSYENCLLSDTVDCDYVWQVIGNLENIEKANLTFITDTHVFLHGSALYCVLNEGFEAVGRAKGEEPIELVLLNEQAKKQQNSGSQKEIEDASDKNGVDILWDVVTSYENSEKKTIFFLDLENLTPEKILFIARLQKHYESHDKNSHTFKIIIYVDDVLAQQLKTSTFQPDLDIVWKVSPMPYTIDYIPAPTDSSANSADANTASSTTSIAGLSVHSDQSKAKEIREIIQNAVDKYKKTLKRFDVIIFVQNEADVEYLKEQSLDLVRETLNVIDLTRIPLEAKDDVAEEVEEAKVEFKEEEQVDAPQVPVENIQIKEAGPCVNEAEAPAQYFELPAEIKQEEGEKEGELKLDVEVEVELKKEEVVVVDAKVEGEQKEEQKVEGEVQASVKVETPQIEEKESMLNIESTEVEYDEFAFNVMIAKSYKQLRKMPLKNVLIQIDSGLSHKLYYVESEFEGIPTLSSKITREEALKRERLMGKFVFGQIYRFFSRKEFLRLQKSDFLNTLNLEQFRNFSEIKSEKCRESQALRILLHHVVNLSVDWFTCSTETGAHVSLLWSRMGDIFSILNCIQSIALDAPSRLANTNENLKDLLAKNQVDAEIFDRLLCDLNLTGRTLLQNGNKKEPTLDLIGLIQKLEKNKLSDLMQKIVIAKYYKNLCVYSGHRRHGYKHFASGRSFHYADQNSMNLIQERPFLMIPLQLSINTKNQLEVKQCIAVDHMLFLEAAPMEFIEKHKLRLLKRQSLNLHEIEYFGIPTALFQYFSKNERLVKSFETQFNCYYEPNLHMDTITIHCDASQKEKIEKHFGEMMEVAKQELNDEIFEYANGKNSILRLQKGGIVKEVIILENDHEFFVDNLRLTVKEEELKELFSEYGDILNVRLFEGTAFHEGEKTMSAEILVADSEDSAFFVEVFDQNIFQGRNITVRNKTHSFKLQNIDDSCKGYTMLRWSTWKSKCTATVVFNEEEDQKEFLESVESGLKINETDVKVEPNALIPGGKGITLKNLNKVTDEDAILKALDETKVASVHVDRIPDLDRGTSKTRLSSLLKEIFGDEQQKIKWIKRKENGFMEAKVCFLKNRFDYMYELDYLRDQEGKLGLQKVSVKHWYTQIQRYDLKMQKIVEMILNGNEQLIEMQRGEQITLRTTIGRHVPSKEEVLVKLKCKDENDFNEAKTILNVLLTPKEFDLREVNLNLPSQGGSEKVDYTQIFTQIGQKTLKELENKYPIVFKVDLQKQEVRAYCTDKIYEIVNREIEFFLRQSIRVKIPISGKNIRNILGTDGKGLEELSKKFELVKIELNYISKDVYMQGGAKQVDQASNALLALLEEKNSASFVNNMPYSYEDCQVCSETISTGYRLQGCGHKFCVNCIMFVIENSLKEVNAFPIKCPCCSVPLVLRDIMALMSEEQIEKMCRMSMNKHVQTNFQTLTFCVGDNCQSVHSSQLSKYTCYECKKTYCAKCAAEYHFGLTCTVYQETEAKNIEYLIKEGARKCPKCSVYIIRIDGCYRVECQRCNCHICWKDNCMKFFEHSSECYNHLDEMHGGYW